MDTLEYFIYEDFYETLLVFYREVLGYSVLLNKLHVYSVKIILYVLPTCSSVSLSKRYKLVHILTSLIYLLSIRNTH